MAKKIDLAKLSQSELAELCASQESKIAELEKSNSEKDGIIADQSKKFEKAEANSLGKIIVTHDGKDYEVVAPRFRVAGKEVKAEDLSKKEHADTLAMLVEQKSGVLKLVSKS